MGRVIFDASAFLAKYGLSTYDLAKEAESLGISRATAYAVASGKANPSLNSLSTLIQAMRNLSGQRVEIQDVIRWVEEEESLLKAN